MSITINVSLDEISLRRFDLIAKKEYTDRSKLLRKWIEKNYKEEYEENNEPE